jgi:hypothetical protein
MLWTCDPANIVISIEISSCLSLLLRNKLKTIIVNEDARSSTIQFVMRDGCLERCYRWNNDTVQVLLVNWHLNRDVAGSEADLVRPEDVGTNGRVASRIAGHSCNWSDNLEHICENANGKELQRLLVR